MERNDPLSRLPSALELARNLVRVAHPAPISVDWSSIDEPDEGLMIDDATRRILLNSRVILLRRRVECALALDAFCGVALHQGSHATYTPREWGERAEALLAAHAVQTGRALPERLVIPVLNWAEDILIEHALVAEFAGFHAYFQNASRYFFRDSTCRRRLARVRRLLAECRRAYRLPARGPALWGNHRARRGRCPAAGAARPAAPANSAWGAAGRGADPPRRDEHDLDRRLGYGIEAADLLFVYVGQFLPGRGRPVAPPANSGTRRAPADGQPGTTPDGGDPTMQALDRSLPKRRLL
jgi:hypothetical protein